MGYKGEFFLGNRQYRYPPKVADRTAGFCSLVKRSLGSGIERITLGAPQ
jgi:hypothetical protein